MIEYKETFEKIIKDLSQEQIEELIRLASSYAEQLQSKPPDCSHQDD